MNYPPLPDDDPLLSGDYYGPGLQKRVELARQLGEQAADRELAEARLLRAFAQSLPDELRKQVELSLLKLRGGLEGGLGPRVVDGAIHVSIYADALDFAPSDSALGELLRRADAWREFDTAVRLARHVLSGASGPYLCGIAINVLHHREQLDPDWYLDYYRRHCAKGHGGDEQHLTPLLACVEALASRHGWDAPRRRDELIGLIRPSLRNLSWNSGMKAVLYWLAGNGLEEGLLEAYSEFLHNSETAPLVPPYIARLSSHGAARNALTRILEGHFRNFGDGYSYATPSAVEPGLDAGLAPIEILKALARNTDRAAVGEAILRMARADRARSLGVSRGDLSAAELSYLEECLAGYVQERMLGEFFWELERRGHPTRDYRHVYELRALLLNPPFIPERAPASASLIAEWGSRLPGSSMLKEMFGPARNADFGALTGLSQPEPVRFEYDDTLRFGYLLEYGRTPNNESLRPLVADLTGGAEPDRLIELERERDRLRDELAFLHAKLEAERGERERDEREYEFQERGWRETKPLPSEGIVRELQQSLNGERFTQLRRASERLTPRLAEMGVTFERWEPEGLLGEFRPEDRAATIYTGMIRVLAGSPEMRKLGGLDEVEAALRAVAEMHEAAHAHLILARSCDRKQWDGFEDSPYSLHEALATALTRRAVEAAQDASSLPSVLNVLESMLPPEYKAASHLHALSGEDLRRFMLSARDASGLAPVAETVSGILDAVRDDAGLIAAVSGEDEYGRFYDVAAAASKEILDSEDAAELAEACFRFFAAVEAETPDLIPLLESLAGVKWPDPLAEVYWRAAGACPVTVGQTGLRLRVEWIGKTPGASALAGYEDVKNSASLGLPDFDNAVRDAGLSPDDPSLRLLRERIVSRPGRATRPSKRPGSDA